MPVPTLDVVTKAGPVNPERREPDNREPESRAAKKERTRQALLDTATESACER